MKKIRIEAVCPTFTWLYPSMEAAHFGVYEKMDPSTIQGVRRLDLDPEDYIEMEWMGFELDRSSGAERFYDFSRMVVVRWVNGVGWRKTLECGWTSPKLIPFNREVNNKFIKITRIDDRDDEFDIDTMFADAEKSLTKK